MIPTCHGDVLSDIQNSDMICGHSIWLKACQQAAPSCRRREGEGGCLKLGWSVTINHHWLWAMLQTTWPLFNPGWHWVLSDWLECQFSTWVRPGKRTPPSAKFPLGNSGKSNTWWGPFYTLWRGQAKWQIARLESWPWAALMTASTIPGSVDM